MTIKELVKKAQNGDEKAYGKLFEHYEEDIYRTAYVYLKNQEDALDAVQETAYRSFKSIGSLQEPGYFKTWLIRIAIRCSIDLLRMRKKVVPLIPQSYETLMKTEDGDIPLALSLKDLIDSLGVDEKSVIVLRFYHDYTLKEISDMLDIPLGTGKTILYRALKKLRTLSEEEDRYGP